MAKEPPGARDWTAEVLELVGDDRRALDLLIEIGLLMAEKSRAHAVLKQTLKK